MEGVESLVGYRLQDGDDDGSRLVFWEVGRGGYTHRVSSLERRDRPRKRVVVSIERKEKLEEEAEPGKSWP